MVGVGVVGQQERDICWCLCCSNLQGSWENTPCSSPGCVGDENGEKRLQLQPLGNIAVGVLHQIAGLSMSCNEWQVENHSCIFQKSLEARFHIPSLRIMAHFLYPNLSGFMSISEGKVQGILCFFTCLETAQPEPPSLSYA